MPRNTRNRHQNDSSSRTNRPVRGPFSSSHTPFFASNVPQVPPLPFITPSIPLPERQTDLPPPNHLIEPTFTVPVWSDLDGTVYEVPVMKEPPNNARQITSPTLKQVRKLRLVEQQEVIMQPKGTAKTDNITKSEAKVVPKDIPILPLKVKPDMVPKVLPTTRKVIPELDLSDVDWAAPLYTLSSARNTTLPAQTTGADSEPDQRGENMVSREVRADTSDDDIDALVKAIANMHPFQSIACSPPQLHTNYQGSSVHVASKQNTIPIGNSDGVGEMHNKPINPTNSKDEAKETGYYDMSGGLKRRSGSVVSLASATSDSFERVEAPAAGKTEDNGAKRKWYKGYRR